MFACLVDVVGIDTLWSYILCGCMGGVGLYVVGLYILCFDSRGDEGVELRILRILMILMISHIVCILSARL